MSESHTYRLESGTFRTRDGVRHEAGDVIELSPDTYAQFSHKLTPVEQDSSEESGSEAETAGESGTETGETSTEIPTDWADLRALASAWDGDEVSGRDNRDEIEAFLADLSDTQVIDLKHEAGLVGGDEA